MNYHWREIAKRYTSPRQRHHLVMLRERLYAPYARASAPRRALPDFIIIGATRSGTTQFFNTIRYHPQIVPARLKEVHFFDRSDRLAQGERAYRSFFPLRREVPEAGVVGEATPNYLYHAAIPEEIAAMVPQVKLVAILRNPVERALSGYFYNKQKGREPRSLEDVFLRSSEASLQEESYVANSFYYTHLQNYERFLQEGRMLLFTSEEWFTTPASVLFELCDFLGVENSFAFTGLSSRNHSKRSQVPPEVYERLHDLFVAHNRNLESYLGRSLGW